MRHIKETETFCTHFEITTITELEDNKILCHTVLLVLHENPALTPDSPTLSPQFAKLCRTGLTYNF